MSQVDVEISTVDLQAICDVRIVIIIIFTRFSTQDQCFRHTLRSQKLDQEIASENAAINYMNR